MAANKFTIAVCWADASGAHEGETQVVAGTTLGEVLAKDLDKLGIPSSVASGAAGIGVWGRVRPQTYVLREGDRVEFYAPLKADPKEQRRRRVL